MYRKISVLLVLVHMAFLSASADENANLFNADLKGVYRMYDFESPRVNAAPPKGYKVFHISHYGRHGSRYLHNESEYDTLNVILHRESLTSYGEHLKEKFDCYYPALKGRATDLSEVGKMQHRLLARRMYEAFPEVFSRGSVVNACSSDIPRCLMSMFNFLDELKQCRKSLDIRADFNSSMVPLFRAQRAKKFPMNEYITENFDPLPLFGRIFKNPEYAMAGTDPHHFAQTLYYYAAHLEGAGIYDEFFDTVLTTREIVDLHKIESEKFSYHSGNLCPENLAVAGPSLMEIIETADKDINSDRPSVRLRFGHDNMVMNIMSLMCLPPFHLARFDCSDVPMASNFRLVFARNKNGDVLVKVQYNEDDVSEWIRWESFRADCIRKAQWNPDTRSVYERNSEYSPLFMAHRGLQSYGPENTIVAFRAAGERNMWAIETDFRITSDGHVVCMHDKTLDRTTDGKGLVCESTLAQVRALRVGPVNTKTVVPLYDYRAIPDKELTVPTMQEYMEICREYGCVAFIELKEDKGIIEKMISAIEEYNLQGRCVVSSGKLELLEKYRSSGGKELIHYIFANPDNLARVRKLGNASVSFKFSDLDMSPDIVIDGKKLTSLTDLVDYVHSLGIRICFRAADSQDTASKHISLGVDCLPTNVVSTLEQ